MMNTHTNPYAVARPRVTTRLAALGVATLAAIGLSLGSGSPALAHDVLVGTSPVGSAESGDAPGLQLDFNNEVMDIGTEMIGVDEAGNSVLEGNPIVSGRSVTQHLVEDLADGDYEVAWKVVSSDGHPIQGIVAVTIVAGYPTEVVPAGAADDHDHEGEGEGEHDHDHADESAASGVTTQDDSQATNGSGSNFALFGWVALFVILGGTAAYLAVSAKKRRAAGAGSGSGTESDSSAESGSSDEPRDTEAGSSDSGANTESAN